MLKPFKIRDLHASPTQEDGKNPLDCFPQSDHGHSTCRRSGVVQLSASDYDEVALSHPRARLTYVDDDDGDIITVGSSLELSQRLDEPIYNMPTQSNPTQDSTIPETMHIFDIRRSNSVTELWKRFEFNPAGRETEDAKKAVESTSDNSTPPSPDGRVSNAGLASNEGSEPLLAAFETEMAKILSASEPRNTDNAEEIPSSTEVPNEPPSSGRRTNPALALAQAMHHLINGAEMIGSEVRSRLPELEHQLEHHLQNAQRVLPENVGSTVQAALASLDAQMRNLTNALNNASSARDRRTSNMFRGDVRTPADAVDSLYNMASELGQMGHTLYSAFETEFGSRIGARDASQPSDESLQKSTPGDEAAVNGDPSAAASVLSTKTEETAKIPLTAEESDTTSRGQGNLIRGAVVIPTTIIRILILVPIRRPLLRTAITIFPILILLTFPTTIINISLVPFLRLPHRINIIICLPPLPPPHPFHPSHTPRPSWGAHGPFRPSFPPHPRAHDHGSWRSAWPFFWPHQEYQSEAPTVAMDQLPDATASAPRPADAVLFIGNVGFNVSEKTIRDVFAAKGFLVDVHLPLDAETRKHAGFGYLYFPSIHAARAALDALQGTHIDGHSINLELSDHSPITSLHRDHPSELDHARRPSELHSSASPSSGIQPERLEVGQDLKAREARPIPLSVTDLCSSNESTDHEPKGNNILSTTPDNFPRLTRDLEQSRFPPLSQIDARVLTHHRRDPDTSMLGASAPACDASHGNDASGRSCQLQGTSGSFPDDDSDGTRSGPLQELAQTSGAGHDDHCKPRRSKSMRYLNRNGDKSPSRALRRRATERHSLRHGTRNSVGGFHDEGCAYDNYSNTFGYSRPRSLPASQEEISVPDENEQQLDPRQSAIDDCVVSLIGLGYENTLEGGIQRIAVYAAAADGKISDAIEMIEEERKAKRCARLAAVMPFRDMRTWQRTFATSVARLNSNATGRSGGTTLLRCAEVLRKSQAGSSSYEDQEIKINGFVRSVRKQKRFAFAEITDGSTIEPLQAFLKPAQAAGLSTGTAVEISGLWKACPPGKEQTHELQTTEVKIVGQAEPETYPIQKKYHSPDFLRSIPHLRLRTPFNSVLSRFRSECLYQLGNVFRDAPNGGYVQVQPPLITSSDCEGAGETFTVLPRETIMDPKSEGNHFFRAPKYLTVSSQLHLEAYAAELGNVWAISPTFRAEKSDTPRHLSEFYMLEAEMNFMDDLDSLTDAVEYVVRDLTRRLYQSPVGQEILTAKRSGESGQDDAGNGPVPNLRQRWVDLMEGPRWRRITYTQAMELLEAAVARGEVSFEYAPTWTEGLQLEHEKYIVDVINGGQPVFVTDYPKAIKPFYMAPSHVAPGKEEDIRAPGETVACFDLLLPEVSEVAGGSLREHRLPNIIQNMRDHGLIKQRLYPAAGAGETPTTQTAPEQPLYPHLQPYEDLGHLQWYADLRRWGSAPHGGFGLGFDRFLSYLAGVSSVRDVVAFPRYFGRADC
ncbi:asparaginyl-tRNA synthetase Slm5 [Aspergillus fumigatus Z5]|nr:asparaginyl-tRNA synthetase Slm5 [Aspergillus fumigatus Z5]